MKNLYLLLLAFLAAGTLAAQNQSNWVVAHPEAFARKALPAAPHLLPSAKTDSTITDTIIDTVAVANEFKDSVAYNRGFDTGSNPIYDFYTAAATFSPIPTVDPITGNPGPTLIKLEQAQRFTFSTFGYDSVFVQGVCFPDFGFVWRQIGSVDTYSVKVYTITGTGSGQTANTPAASPLGMFEYVPDTLPYDNIALPYYSVDTEWAMMFDEGIEISGALTNNTYYVSFEVDGIAPNKDDTIFMACQVPFLNYSPPAANCESFMYWKLQDQGQTQVPIWRELNSLFGAVNPNCGLGTAPAIDLMVIPIVWAYTTEYDTTFLTGTNERFVQEGGLKLYNPYPNPASDLLMVEYSLDSYADAWIYLMDLQGRVIDRQYRPAQAAGTRQQHSLDVSQLANGTYTVAVFSHAGRMASRVLVQH